jgi:hypothetical protein
MGVPGAAVSLRRSQETSAEKRAKIRLIPGQIMTRKCLKALNKSAVCDNINGLIFPPRAALKNP